MLDFHNCGGILLVLLLESHKNAFALGWYQAFYNFLGDVLGRVVEQLLELQVGKLFDDLFFARNLRRIDCFKLLDLVLFFKLVLNQSSTAVEHLVQAVLKARCHVLPLHLTTGLRITFWLVGIIPDIVCYEALDAPYSSLRQ